MNCYNYSIKEKGINGYQKKQYGSRYVTLWNFYAKNYQGFVIRFLIPAVKQNYVTVIEGRNPVESYIYVVDVYTYRGYI